MGKKNKIKEVYEERNDCFCFYCGKYGMVRFDWEY